MVLSALVCTACVILAVALHLSVLLLLTRLVNTRLQVLTRLVVGVMVLCAIVGHLLEIGLFAGGIAIVATITHNDADLVGNFDLVYHSAIAYTSLGGDPFDSEQLRLITAVEALTGLILITWTASFVFLVMQREWDTGERTGK